MYVIYENLFLFVTMIVSILALILSEKNRKK